MFCSKCGGEAKALSGTCGYCGAYLTDAVAGSYSNFLRDFLKCQVGLTEKSSHEDWEKSKKHKKIQAASILELYLPNDIENLVELAFSLKSQAVSSSRGGIWGAMNGTVVSRAWLSKLQQVTDKLKLMARDDEALSPTVSSLESSADEAKRNLQRSQFGLNLVVFGGMFIILAINAITIWDYFFTKKFSAVL